MNLLTCPKNAPLSVVSLPEDGTLSSQMLRFGLSPGVALRVSQRLPGGTTVVRLGRQELVFGRGNAGLVAVATTT